MCFSSISHNAIGSPGQLKHLARIYEHTSYTSGKCNNNLKMAEMISRKDATMEVKYKPFRVRFESSHNH